MKKIVVCYGPSGAGKTSLAKELINLGYIKIIGSTTRVPRAGETNGIDYYFLDKEEFLNTEMVETAQYADDYYGTQLQEVQKKLEQSDKVFAILESNGVKSFKEYYGDLVTTVYIYCSPEVSRQHMENRGDDPLKIEKRLRNAFEKGEFNNISLADYVIINEKTFEESFKLLKFMLGEE